MTLRWQQSQDRLRKGKPSSPPRGIIGNLILSRDSSLYDTGDLSRVEPWQGRLQQTPTTLSAGGGRYRWMDGVYTSHSQKRIGCFWVNESVPQSVEIQICTQAPHIPTKEMELLSFMCGAKMAFHTHDCARFCHFVVQPCSLHARLLRLHTIPTVRVHPKLAYSFVVQLYYRCLYAYCRHHTSL